MGISLAALSLATLKVTSPTTRIYRLFAFLGRYAHQPISDMRQMTTRELQRLADAIAEIMEDEQRQHRNMTDPD